MCPYRKVVKSSTSTPGLIYAKTGIRVVPGICIQS